MRVRATATGSNQSNAIGQIELSCTPAGLSIGLYGVGAYQEGYATGALTMGTRFTIPYSGIKTARVIAEQLYLELSAPGFPHNRLMLSRFTAGPGVPPLELKRRRLILQFTALSVAALACLAATIFAPSLPGQKLAWGALGYGALAGSLVLLLGFLGSQNLLIDAPGETQTREAFLAELQLNFPRLERAAQKLTKQPKRAIPHFTQFLPRTAMTVGLTLATTILTVLVTSQRLLTTPSTRTTSSRSVDSQNEAEPERHSSPISTPPSPRPTPAAPAERAFAEEPPNDPRALPPTKAIGSLVVERKCLCDRADSQLWKKPIPRLSGVLIERRIIPRKTHVRTQIQLAIVNNSDSPIDEITLHVQFYERKGKKRRATKERPLYFEGPLRPGEAIKWTAEARGTEFEVSIPDLGNLGPAGDGAAQPERFLKLLKANHRPVRLHAARMLSYLGHSSARTAALELKDAMRAAEAPYLRRILAATGNTRVCDIELRKESTTTLGVCVYNSSNEALDEWGVQLNALSGTLDVDHPLANPPTLRTSAKWQLPEALTAQAGLYVRVPLPIGFLSEKGSSLEVMADRFDLLD